MSRNGDGSVSNISVGLMFIHALLSNICPPHFCSLPDVPGGFSLSQGEEPREGGDLQLTCAANRYLYTALSWRRVEDARRHGSALSVQKRVEGEFSHSLLLLIRNLTTADSGRYRCSAHHLVTGQETHLDAQVLVRSESRPKVVISISASGHVQHVRIKASSLKS